jgi:p24 family protein delta-1
LTILIHPHTTHAIKFTLQAYRYPEKKCLWNPAHEDTLVIVTANSGPAAGQHTDIEIVDSSPQQNVYLRKRGIKAETRMAITTHVDGDVGVCFYNYLDEGPSPGSIVGVVLICFFFLD